MVSKQLGKEHNIVYNLLFKSCQFAPQCLRKTKSQQSTRLNII
jgi:hypothetical protein